MYYLTTALVYNTTQLKRDDAPQSYEDLLNPKWKGKLVTSGISGAAGLRRFAAARPEAQRLSPGVSDDHGQQVKRRFVEIWRA